MSNEYFQFKQFRIAQDRTAMKVGTDGVLLGAWATSINFNKVLDIGTGTGLIALIAAQELPQAIITAIDIDADAVGQAKENVAQSPWANRIDVQQVALQQFTPHCKYDLILSNPPYYIKSQKSPDRQRSLARHADTLPMPTLMKHSASMLTPEGKLAIIIPTEIVSEAERWAAIYGLFLAHRIDVKTMPTKVPKRSIVTFTPTRPETIIVATECIHTPDGNYTPWYTSLTERLYLSVAHS